MATPLGDTPIAILDATLRVIAKGGVDAVRYRDVAREAKLPLGTVSYHFPSRADLVHGAFDHFLAESRAALSAIRARVPAETLEDLAGLLTAFARAYLADRGRCRAEYELMVYAAREPALYAELAAWDHARQSELALVLERLGLPGPNATAQTLVDTIRGFQLSQLGNERPDLDGLRARLRDVLLGLVPRDGA